MYLFVFDLDDTLFESNTFIDTKTAVLLNKLLKEGNYIAINSGRPLFGIKRFLKDIKLNDHFFYIAFNGSAVFNYKEKSFYTLSLESEDLNYFFNKYKDNEEIFVYAWTSDNNIIAKNVLNYYTKHELNYNDAGKIVDIYRGFSNYTITKIVIAAPKEVLDKLEFSEEEKNKFLIQRTRKVYYEIMNKDADKVKGVDFLKDYLKIPKENIFTFGDALNDLEMIKSYNGVCPIDGDPLVKTNSKFIMLSAKENGVYNFISEHFKEK
jgi:Cof subfamily protein (haloacid dehalogenase superfamily)